MSQRWVVVSLFLVSASAAALISCGKGGGSSVTQPGPSCVLNPGSLNFGSVVVGQSKDLPFVISNSGGGTLTGTASACGDYSIQGDASYDLGAGASDTILVRFAPTLTGARNCGMAVGSSCGNLSCIGSGAATACQLSATDLAFGRVGVGQTADRSFTITNIGSGTLAGTASSLQAEYTIQGTASYDLGPNAAATINVRFAPTVSGAVAGTIETGSAECGDISVSGTAIELNSPLLGPGAMYQHTFMTAGAYPYHCEIHTVMQGTVTVDPSGPASVSVSIVSATSSGFSPSAVTVAPGGTVTWTNNHSVSHTVTSD